MTIRRFKRALAVLTAAVAVGSGLAFVHPAEQVDASMCVLSSLSPSGGSVTSLLPQQCRPVKRP